MNTRPGADTTAHTAALTPAHPCVARPVPASVLRQREAAMETAFARALRDADEPPLVTTPETRAHTCG
ncbi:MAG TPA: hypothetical protein VD997_09190 [Phycisphaerales bacterium]|nr:hypothetical protein [Phycisphaerales bacterium]